MRVIVTGSTGLVGAALVRSLLADGHAITRLVRGETQTFKAPNSKAVLWDPLKGSVDASELEGHDAAVHLAGEPIAEGRWTDERKRRILESRSVGTRVLADSLARLENKPAVLVSASAIGFYGDRGAEQLDESSVSGNNFVSEVARGWESATLPASEAGIRVVHLRIGVVLSASGGAVKKMLTPFKLGVGGKVGSGEQFMSWIVLDDLVGIIKYAIVNKNLNGPVNAVAPNPVSNAEFTKALGRTLGRPTIFPLPAFAARLVFGEMADELLLASTRVEPAKLKQSGYEFAYPKLEAGLKHVLSVPPA